MTSSSAPFRRVIWTTAVSVTIAAVGLTAGCTQSKLLPDEATPTSVEESGSPKPTITAVTTSTALPAQPSPAVAETTSAPPFADGGDPLRSEQSHIEQLAVPSVWSTTTGAGQVIAIIDTGVDLTHPDLAPHVVAGINLVSPGEPPQDDNGHGTHVAGIAAAVAGNGVGVSGIAPGASIMPVKVLDAAGAGSTSTIAAGIDWATTNGATVINLSLGESGALSRVTKGGEINLALRQAAAAGVVIVAASGNDSTFKRGYRAGIDVIVVNACDAIGAPADFTNAGDPRSLTAPGVDVLSTAPTGPTTIWPGGSSGYEKLSGTSMASPIVAGAAALLLAKGVPAGEVSARLASTAANANGDVRLGAGIISPGAAVASG